jgi:Ca2+-binding EF-hand superfamily protein
MWVAGIVAMAAGATVMAQQPRDDGDEPRGRRGRAAQEDQDSGDQPSGRRGRGRADDENGRGDGRFGRGGPGGFFRRPNPMFQAIDANSDGEISETELKRAVTALKKLDADSDGKITLEEASPQGGPGGPFGDANAMIDRWMENDANGDGKLQVDEVPERMAWMLQGADQNNDQAVDRAELEQVMGRMRERMQGGGPGGGFGGGRFGPGGDPAQWARQFDRNNDGQLTPNEVPPPVADMLRSSNADANGDGAVDANELRDAARRMGDRSGGGRGFGQGGPGDRGGYGDRGGRGRRGAEDDDDRPRRPESE